MKLNIVTGNASSAEAVLLAGAGLFTSFDILPTINDPSFRAGTETEASVICVDLETSEQLSIDRDDHARFDSQTALLTVGCCRSVTESIARLAVQGGVRELLILDAGAEANRAKLQKAKADAISQAAGARRLRDAREWARSVKDRYERHPIQRTSPDLTGRRARAVSWTLAQDTLRNLLVPIVGIPDLLAIRGSKIGPEERRAFGKMCLAAIIQFDLVIEALLSLSRLAAFEFLPQSRAVPLTEILHDAQRFPLTDTAGNDVPATIDQLGGPSSVAVPGLCGVVAKLVMLGFGHCPGVGRQKISMSVAANDDKSVRFSVACVDCNVPFTGIERLAGLAPEASQSRVSTHQIVPFTIWLAAELAQYAGYSVDWQSETNHGTVVDITVPSVD